MVPGRVVVGVVTGLVVVVVVVTGLVGVGVAVRVNLGRDQLLVLLVRLQPEWPPDPERRGVQPSWTRCTWPGGSCGCGRAAGRRTGRAGAIA